MYGLSRLNDYARDRGDGLHPRLLELLQGCTLHSGDAANIVDMAAWRGDGAVQAGPNPCPNLPAELPANVRLLRESVATGESDKRHNRFRNGR